MTPPYVTCMCLTRNRRQWLLRAIDCFQQSTYKNRELLILNSGESIADIVPADQRIRVVRVAHGRTIGELRNAAVELARGEIIAHWDDDDYSAPERLEDQVARLLGNNKQVTGYSSMVFESETELWSFEAQFNFGIGTSLCYQRDWALAHPFKALHVAEDRYFSNEARDHGELVSAPDTGLMRASIHSGNTSKRSLTGDNWKFIGARSAASIFSDAADAFAKSVRSLA